MYTYIYIYGIVWKGVEMSQSVRKNGPRSYWPLRMQTWSCWHRPPFSSLFSFCIGASFCADTRVLFLVLLVAAMLFQVPL